MLLRPATEADRPAIAAMAAEVVAAGEMFVYESAEEVLAYWHDPRGAVWVAQVEGEVRGTYVIKPNQPGRGAHVANAGYMVLESARGRGLGRTMGEHSLQAARDLGFEAMQFNFVVASNADALHLWSELGFAIVGTLPAAFTRPDGERVDAFVLYRRL